MGKSVLLATMAMQFRRYPGSRIFAFDMGALDPRPSWAWVASTTTWARTAALRLPAAGRIDREGYRTWASRMDRRPPVASKAWPSARTRRRPSGRRWEPGGAPVEQRTLTGLSVLLQSNALRQALAPMSWAAHGKLLDADHDRLGTWPRCSVRDGELMHSPAAVMAGAALPVRALR